MIATVFVPLGKTEYFVRVLERYLTKQTAAGAPRHSDLVENIAAIRRAVIDSFWTDDEDARPESGERAWWEVWLRSSEEEHLARFRRAAAAAEIRVPEATIRFAERRVVLVHATREQLAAQPALLDTLAELRRAKETAREFLKLSPVEQSEWVADLQRRLQPPAADAPVICILDTGVNRGHQLIAPALPESNLFAYRTAWRVEDHHGHGTEMASLALYGDLKDALQHGGRVRLEHGLESAKILPPTGSNTPELYGSITIDAAAQAEAVAPARRRTFSLAVTTTDSRDRGRPSSWSAAVDQLAAAAGEAEGAPRRLFCVAAGNTDAADRVHYPDSNFVEGIHDPGQAWNALTVGAYADRVEITDPEFDGYTALAKPGDLGPSSTTSLTWERSKWPLKPDVVLDGGNQASRTIGDSSIQSMT